MAVDPKELEKLIAASNLSLGAAERLRQANQKPTKTTRRGRAAATGHGAEPIEVVTI